MVTAGWAVRDKRFNCCAVLTVIKTYRYRVYIEIFVTVNCGAGPKTSYHSKPNLGRAITTQNFPLTPSFTIFSFFFFLLEEKKVDIKSWKRGTRPYDSVLSPLTMTSTLVTLRIKDPPLPCVFTVSTDSACFCTMLFIFMSQCYTQVNETTTSNIRRAYRDLSVISIF